MGSLSIGHWLIVMLIAAVVFGPKRLAEVGGGLGKGIRAFKQGVSEDEHDAVRPESSEPDPTKRLT